MGNQTQHTAVNGHTPEKARVTCGTTQVLTLGPLLVIIYINDIFNSIGTDGNIYMYADDTLLVCKSGINNVAAQVQEALNQNV